MGNALRKLAMTFAMVFVLLAAAVAVAPQSAQAADAGTVEALINQQRAANGLPALTVSSSLRSAAANHSANQANAGYLCEHSCPPGYSTIQQRVNGAGFYNWWGEIVGWGFGGNDAQMVNWWMNSPSHRSQILNPNYTHMGAGVAYNGSSTYGYYWTVDFGA